MRNIDPQEWEVRCDLAAAYRLIAYFGMDDLIFTHLSARLPGKDHRFLLNPYGYLFDEGRYDTGKKLDYLRATVEIAFDRDDLGPEFRAFLKELVIRRGLLD